MLQELFSVTFANNATEKKKKKLIASHALQTLINLA